MAWFDVLQALGQGAAQGAETFQALKAQQRATARQAALDARAMRQEKQQQADRDRLLFERQLQNEDPTNIDPAFVASSPLSKEYVRKDDVTGNWVLKEPPQAATERKLAAMRADIQGATLPQEREEVLTRTAARKKVQGPGFASLPYAERVQTMLEAGLTTEQMMARLSPTEQQQYAMSSPEALMRQTLLTKEQEGRERLTDKEIAAQFGVAKMRVDADVAAAIMKAGIDANRLKTENAEQLRRSVIGAAVNLIRARGGALTQLSVQDAVNEILPALGVLGDTTGLAGRGPIASGSASTKGQTIRSGPITLEPWE